MAGSALTRVHSLPVRMHPVIGQQNMEWVVDMEPRVSADCCIYRVPCRLRILNEESYTPEGVSIGPFHHGGNRLQVMEGEKVRCLDSFLGWTGLDLEVLESTVLLFEERIRGCYGETIQLNSNDFVKMIVMDAVFILQLFLSLEPFVRLHSTLRSSLIRDLILLENQIPFFIIDKLLALANPQLTLEELTFAFFEVFLGKEPVPFPDVEIKHFTDLLRTFQLPPPPPERLRRDRSDVVNHLYSVSQLHEAGVKFKVSSSKFLLDLKFSNGVLEIPSIRLERRTEAVFRNLLAFEQCHYSDDACIADYCVILHYLLNTARDVDLLLLCDKEIIVNRLGDSTEAMTMVKSLPRGLVLKNMLSDYGRLGEALNEFYANPWHSWKATLRREYFSTPWRTASTMAAVIFLVLTMIQTVCSIIQVVPKHK